MSARIRIHEKTLTATLAGIDYSDLRHLLTLAANSAYDRMKTDPGQRAYYEGVVKQIKALEETANPQMDRIRARRSGLSTEPPAPPTKADRRARLERDRLEDAILDDLVSKAVAARRKRDS